MKNVCIFKEKPENKINPVLVKRMEQVIKEVILHKKFHRDFYQFDLVNMKKIRTFAWYVYDCGTCFFPVQDIDAVRSFQNEWLSKVKDIRDKKMKSLDRLYLCDTKTGFMKELVDFEYGDLLEGLYSAM
ncbi:hypothetical protein YDYSY3_38830 [Paenibacillus chitinolyticus]|uniref:hypothetical protein n=1 Tax=Paenibacillus chitinolyticus TaxID=79263 RepID=UPI0026E4B2A7|nr:hypothetical protein [Paenibacillus chitinolyticus]GKS12883.1 hypothetical protein YDYSY3_38830 [Paenibacillus chitinolyticus]